MTLRSRLIVSHLTVLLVFILVHLALFVLATRMSQKKDAPSIGLREFQWQTEAIKDPAELTRILTNFAAKNSLGVEVQSSEGTTEYIGQALREPRGGGEMPWHVIWQGTNGVQKAIRFHGLDRPGPPANPILHILATTLFAALFAVLLAFFYSRSISRPLADLVLAVERIEGDVTETSVDVDGPEEIQELASSFHRMSKRLAESMGELRSEKERAQASEESRKQFLSDVSHNLRTPMAATIGWIDSLLDGHIEDQEKCLRQVRREVYWAAKTLERLLHLSRWEHSGPIVAVERLSLSEVVMETAETLEEAAQEKALTLDLQIERGCTVEADKHHLRDLLQILLENVIEHAGQNKTVTIKTQTADGWVRVTVSDDGVGIPPELLASWSGAPQVATTGRVSLGLAIASRLAQAHGKPLELKSGTSAPGTTATFSLPVGEESGEYAQ